MIMPPRLRKLALTLHIIFSVGWLGAVVVYLVLAISGLGSTDDHLITIVYPALEIIGWYIIVPASWAALVTGLIQSFGTTWGLFQHYWVLVKFILTFGASIILIKHMPKVSEMANMVIGGNLTGSNFEQLRKGLVIHAAGGLLVLIITTVLSVFKPWGRTRYGSGKQTEIKKANTMEPKKEIPWAKYILYTVIAIVVAFVVMHLVNGGASRH
jgi:hypothetical protein